MIVCMHTCVCVRMNICVCMRERERVCVYTCLCCVWQDLFDQNKSPSSIICVLITIFCVTFFSLTNRSCWRNAEKDGFSELFALRRPPECLRDPQCHFQILKIIRFIYIYCALFGWNLVFWVNTRLRRVVASWQMVHAGLQSSSKGWTHVGICFSSFDEFESTRLQTHQCLLHPRVPACTKSIDMLQIPHPPFTNEYTDKKTQKCGKCLYYSIFIHTYLTTINGLATSDYKICPKESGAEHFLYNQRTTRYSNAVPAWHKKCNSLLPYHSVDLNLVLFSLFCFVLFGQLHQLHKLWHGKGLKSEAYGRHCNLGILQPLQSSFRVCISLSRSTSVQSISEQISNILSMCTEKSNLYKIWKMWQ